MKRANAALVSVVTLLVEEVCVSQAAIAAPLGACWSVWDQCGGNGFTGATCCEAGSTCVMKDAYYSQCLPDGTPVTPTPAPGPSPPLASCRKQWERCGGNDFAGATCCEAGSTCVLKDAYYSQCLPDGTLVNPTAAPGPSPPSASCQKQWEQCGGNDFAGATCCEAGSTCMMKDRYYSQCLPDDTPVAPTPAPGPSPSSASCQKQWERCGGNDFAGATCCEAGSTCVMKDPYYSQCLPDTAPTPVPPPAPQPTSQPSAIPTPQPTLQPTLQPTPRPSALPTPQPTVQPTPQPTLQPTPQPSTLPTPQPTAQPTPQPTLQPTPQPSTLPTPQPTVQPTPQPTPQPAPLPTATPTQTQPDASTLPDVWTGNNMKLTHYWDCNGQGCDASTLQPWDINKYISPSGYGPQDPNDFGGPLYGETMWLTGAASDTLSQLMGDDDGCCGGDPNDGGVGGCGKCMLIQNPESVHADWKALVMKKNRCPPWSNGCGAGEPHFDIAAPGFDNLQWSTANVCGLRPGTGFESQRQSEALGKWWEQCSDTAQCEYLCDQLPASFQKGCRLFASWGWQRGDPDKVKFQAVPCPPEFVEHVGSLFGASGVEPHTSSSLLADVHRHNPPQHPGPALAVSKREAAAGKDGSTHRFLAPMRALVQMRQILGKISGLAKNDDSTDFEAEL